MPAINKKKIVFFGTPAFSVPFLDILIKKDYNVLAVVTAPDKPVGRKQELKKSPIRELAENYKIPILTPEKIKSNQNFTAKLKSQKPDLCVLVAYGKIIPKEVLSIPRLGFVNVHPSLLPKYRGSSPLQYALMEGKKETGITIMRLDEKMDTGDILYQMKVKIEEGETSESLHGKIGRIGSEFLTEKLPEILDGKAKATKQDDGKATYTKLISRQDAMIDFSQSVIDIENKGRAFYPWPGLFMEFNGKRLKVILPKAVVKTVKDAKPGKTIVTDDGKFAIMGKDGMLIPERLQLEGRKELSNNEFVNGTKNK